MTFVVSVFNLYTILPVSLLKLTDAFDDVFVCTQAITLQLETYLSHPERAKLNRHKNKVLTIIIFFLIVIYLLSFCFGVFTLNDKFFPFHNKVTAVICNYERSHFFGYIFSACRFTNLLYRRGYVLFL